MTPTSFELVWEPNEKFNPNYHIIVKEFLTDIYVVDDVASKWENSYSVTGFKIILPFSINSLQSFMYISTTLAGILMMLNA